MCDVINGMPTVLWTHSFFIASKGALPGFRLDIGSGFASLIDVLELKTPFEEEYSENVIAHIF